MSDRDAPRLAADLPVHARERLTEMRARSLFTSDLSVNEFVLVREAGFEPLGLVMGTSIYQLKVPTLGSQPHELEDMTRALYHARELAMTRMEEEADALGADGVVGLRLTVNLSTDPRRVDWKQYRAWSRWSKQVGFRRPLQFTMPASGWFAGWRDLAASEWARWCKSQGWEQIPLAPWWQTAGQTSYSLGANTAEFIAIGTAIRHARGENFRNAQGKPFQSDLSGQDFWLLIRSGYRPVGLVMGNCVYYVPPAMLRAASGASVELAEYTHALYDARELAIERLQDEAEALGATGIVGVDVTEEQHSWRTDPTNVGNAALKTGEVIELFVIGTAVVPAGQGEPLAAPELAFSANDALEPAGIQGMTPAISELSVTEFLALSRIGFLPRGLVAGCCVFGAGTQYDWTVRTGEIRPLSDAIRKARSLAVNRMREQAANLHADGIVGVRLEVEHEVWRGARLVAKCVAVGTAIAFDRDHAPPELRGASSLRLASGMPFNSDLKGHELVTLLAAGYRPVTVAMGNCVYGLDPRQLRAYRGRDAEIGEFTQAFFDAREAAMDRLQKDLFTEGHRRGHADAPAGVVGMTVTEGTYGGQGSSGPPIVEFSAIGTAVAALAPDDPRRGAGPPKPRLVVPLDR